VQSESFECVKKILSALILCCDFFFTISIGASNNGSCKLHKAHLSPHPCTATKAALREKNAEKLKASGKTEKQKTEEQLFFK